MPFSVGDRAGGRIGHPVPRSPGWPPSGRGLNNEVLAVEVWRGAATGAFQTFTVPRRLNQTILDVVTEIQRDQDPTLSYRFACRVGMCGSCAMVVNGRPPWTRRTRASQAA